MASEGWKILQEHGPAVHALLLRLTVRPDVADDLLHDLFVKVASRIARVEHPAAYMARAAINLAMDWRRTRTRQPPTVFSFGQQPTPGASLEQAEEIDRILDAAQNLSELEQQVFVLRFIQQESHDRIGQMLGKTPHQSRGLCDAVVKHIRKELAERRVNHERY